MDDPGQNDPDGHDPGRPGLPPPPASTRGLGSDGERPRPAPVGATTSLPGTLVLIGGILAVVGAFLPWLTATAAGSSVSQNGIKIGTWGTLILGGFALVRGLSILRPGTFRVQLGTPTVTGAFILGLVALRWSSLQDAVKQTEALGAGVTASIGIGAWATIAGGVCVLAGGVLLSREQQR